MKQFSVFRFLDDLVVAIGEITLPFVECCMPVYNLTGLVSAVEVFRPCYLLDIMSAVRSPFFFSSDVVGPVAAITLFIS